MTGEVLSSSPGWWLRLLRRILHRQPSIVSQLPRVIHPLPKTAAVLEPTSAITVAVEIADPDAKQSLLDTLRADELPLPLRAPGASASLGRDKTLVAVTGLRQIPGLQSLVRSFIKSANRSGVSVEEVVDAIQKDSALCVRVLRMANSTFISPSQPIEDLNVAVQMLGVARVRRTAQAMITLRDACNVAEGLDWRHLWIHAFATAAIAEELERQLRPLGEPQVYLAALLHDVGKIVLSTVAPETYRTILLTAWQDDVRLEELERERLGMDHREAGAIFARNNKLSDVVVNAVAHHDDPASADKFAVDIAFVSLANYVSKSYGLGFSGSRIKESDGEFDELPAWTVIDRECGHPFDRELIENGLREFVVGLRGELAGLREKN